MKTTLATAHVRNLEGADVATFGANLVEKVEYQP